MWGTLFRCTLTHLHPSYFVPACSCQQLSISRSTSGLQTKQLMQISWQDEVSFNCYLISPNHYDCQTSSTYIRCRRLCRPKGSEELDLVGFNAHSTSSRSSVRKFPDSTWSLPFSKFPPWTITHLSPLVQWRKQLWNCWIARRVSLVAAVTSCSLLKRRPRKRFSIFRKRKKSHGEMLDASFPVFQKADLPTRWQNSMFAQCSNFDIFHTQTSWQTDCTSNAHAAAKHFLNG
jgi:hypothetical protein